MNTITTDAAAVTDLARLAPSVGAGFPDRATCRTAARLLHDDWRDDHTDDTPSPLRTGDLADACSIGVTPGGITLLRRRQPEGREARPLEDDRPHEHHVWVPGTDHALWLGEIYELPTSVRKPLTDTDVCPTCAPDAVRSFIAGLCTVLGGLPGPPTPALHGPLEPAPPAPCRWWSSRSRARMVRALATVDWSPVMLSPGTRPAMVTLTYPGDWLTVAPTADATKQHLRRLHERIRRLYRRLDLDDPSGIWKLEFQARGAPHFHLYLPVPVGRLNVGSRRVNFGEWLSEAWASIVDHPDPEHRARHRLAGTGVDFAEGSRASDPKRLATYFVRHNAKGASKAYQHRVPPEWATPGRWWGTWGVERIDEQVPISTDELVSIKRLLRRWTSRHRTPAGFGREHASTSVRLAPRRVRRVDRRTGLVRYRWVTRRYRVASLAQAYGGFVLANDGPALAGLIGRLLDAERARHDPPRPLDPGRWP